MAHNKNLILTLLCAVLIIPLVSQAGDISQSSSIVKFQYKLASKGNPQAQYRLACMFENGDGIEVDLEKAKYWYDLAAKSGLKAAVQRRTYLEVKEKGFDSIIHADWLAEIQVDSEANKSYAVLLQAQLYQKGIGVKKNLKVSLELYNRISIQGEANVESEIILINKEISAGKKALQINSPSRQLPPVEEKETIAAPVITQESSKNKLGKNKPSKDRLSKHKKVKANLEKEKQLSQAEKIKRYEKAREQLLKEQALIDELQNKISGGNNSDIDDEI